MSILLLLPFLFFRAFAQSSPAEEHDPETPLKIEHAEPLYIDLIRDLGARKGEKEWNVGMGLTDKLAFDQYLLLVEYEWAPIDRLGLEVEVPVTIFSSNAPGFTDVPRPSDRVESIKTALQWTFLVTGRHQTSLALGFINELEFTDLNTLSANRIFRGNVYNPFFVAAKRWPHHFHTLLYTGPLIEHRFGEKQLHTLLEVNTNLHYMLPGTRNFVGLEVNKTLEKGNFDMVLRPQIRVSLMDNLLVGLVTGIPVSKQNERLSSFVRLIYEPGHTHLALPSLRPRIYNRSRNPK
ncbi:hypothetical protein BH24BAC1_BH24BAC1_25970 [soil metagenome]